MATRRLPNGALSTTIVAGGLPSRECPMKTTYLSGFMFVAMLTVSAAAEAQQIPYRRDVNLIIGQSAIIHGARGECGRPQPDWDLVFPRLPHSLTGSFSDGGTGTRQSRSCGGPTPARAVRFTAERAGSEQIELFGDTINITVEYVRWMRQGCNKIGKMPQRH